MSNPVTNEQIEAMLAGLEGVTPGPWYQTGAPWFSGNDGVLAGSPDGNIAYLIADCDDGMNPREEYLDGHAPFPLGDKDADAAHIARCDPDTMRSILSELLSRRTTDRETGESPFGHEYGEGVKLSAIMAALDNPTKPEAPLPDGEWVLVPREPTKAMKMAIAAADWQGTSDLNWSDGWRIMVEAAPAPSETVVTEAMVERAYDAWLADTHAEDWGVDEIKSLLRAALTAALAGKP